MSLQPGQKIGDYEVVAKLGAGGLGVVYEVRHLISERREAMKIMLPDQSGAPEMAERFRREVKTLATLSHVNIASLHTAFYHEDQLAMVMELIHGETLRNLRLKTAITLQQALDFVAQILQALVYAHGLGVVHRDIKPANIMITKAGTVKLLDFGIAVTGHSSDLTQAGHLLGSISYMSPEQINGHKATTRSDLYSLGVTLYEMLTGRLPIAGSTVYEIMMNHVQQEPVPPHQLDANIPVSISEAVMCSLAKDPAQRFATAEAFLEIIRLDPTIRMDSALTLPRPQHAASSSSRPSGSNQQKTPSSGSLQTLPLEEITRKLAVYIGPVAKFVVKKLAAQSEDTDFIFREAAKQITSDTDRAAFLRSRK
jgi:serine/threonine protein kinase